MHVWLLICHRACSTMLVDEAALSISAFVLVFTSLSEAAYAYG